MRFKLGSVLLMVLGSFLIYCAQETAGELLAGGDAGMVPDAAAQSGGACCTAQVPQPEIVFDGPLTWTNENGACVTQAFNIAPYNEVVLHGPDLGSTVPSVQFKHGAAGWRGAIGSSGALMAGNNIVTISPRWGAQMRLVYHLCPIPDSRAPGTATVVGYK